MKRETIFLKVVIVLLGLFILGLCVFFLPWLISDIRQHADPLGKYLYPIIVAMYTAAIPFFYALFQALKLLTFIDKGNAFTRSSVQAIKVIKLCAIVISLIYLAVMPFFFLFGDKDDSPGFILIGAVFVGASFVVAVFAAVLQKLLTNAIDIKSENDLTV
ncbi:DUF2975 domain-containing protein [Paenisporosarcina cavernae]|uniref:DUF2975 domain-containing protein n=1 Tax=Paenisporosarcina cavernae TaxID=2320858 RepID=A0A385YVA8_9BACL|nr:DUF2975 domain-containing protein [Paenisporosarcina cavernae]AYC30484.1 DUF2975 domain-containing protein [Paenisporosarcina cavernae]